MPLNTPQGRVKIDGGLGGSTALEQWSTPLEKCQNGAGGSVLNNFQLNNSLNIVIFDILHFPGKISKFDPPWKNLTLPGKKSLIFTLPQGDVELCI